MLPKIPASRKSGKLKLTKTEEITMYTKHISPNLRYKHINWERIVKGNIGKD